MSEMGESIQRVTDEDRLKGVRGLLLVPPVVILWTDLGLTVELLRPLFSASVNSDQWLGVAIISAVLLPLSAFAVIRLMQEKKSARYLLMAFFGIFALLSAIGLAAITPNSSGFQMIIGALRAIGVPVAVILYLLFLKRVKVTLVDRPSVDVTVF